MDFLKEAHKLTEAAKTTSETVANSVSKMAEDVNQAIVEMTQASKSAVEDFSDRTAQSTQHTLETVAQTLEIQRVSAAEAMQQTFDQTSEQVLSAIALAIGASGFSITTSLKDVPRTVEQLANDMPKIAQRLRHRAGIRVGDPSRSDADVMGLFDKIPGTSKLGANEHTIREFLADKQGSHVIPRSQGGGNGADNIVWEIGVDNFRRGANVMTGGEQLYIRVYNAVDSIVKNSGAIAQLGLAATGTAILTQTLVTAVAYTLDLYRGDITIDEFKTKIIAVAVTTGVTAPIFFVILIAVLALFPELTVILAAPAVVAGFNALFGVSIALPIIQSLLRHLEAGGFGQEIGNEYEAMRQQAQDWIDVSTNDLRRYCETLVSGNTPVLSAPTDS